MNKSELDDILKIRDAVIKEVKHMDKYAKDKMENDYFFRALGKSMEESIGGLATESIMLLFIRQQKEMDILRKQVNALASIIAEK